MIVSMLIEVSKNYVLIKFSSSNCSLMHITNLRIIKVNSSNLNNNPNSKNLKKMINNNILLQNHNNLYKFNNHNALTATKLILIMINGLFPAAIKYGVLHA